MLGATAPGTGLVTQFIILNVKRIDGDKLRDSLKLEGVKAAGMKAALAAVDNSPKMALDLVAPFARNYLKDNLGVDAEITVADKAPPARGKSEFWMGLGFGAGAVALVATVGWGAWKLLFKRFLS